MQKEKYHNFIAGWGAGFVETLLLYPQNKMIFRQQLQGITAKEVFQQLRNEGCWMLYRGILPPLIQRTTTRSVMFGMFDKFHRYFNCSECQTTQTRIACFTCAAFMAGAVEAILCPLERTQVLLQSPMYNQSYQNTGHAFNELARIGPKELYRGFTVVLLRNGLSNVLFFTLRKPFRNLVIDCDQQCISHYTGSRTPEQLVTFIGDFISGAILVHFYQLGQLFKLFGLNGIVHSRNFFVELLSITQGRSYRGVLQTLYMSFFNTYLQNKKYLCSHVIPAS
ncbi:Mitochondrial nicotinamide adenine dinucleotide transporter SLC25A51 [Dirofilaria immitis]